MATKFSPERLRDLRHRKALTTRELAQLSGVSRWAIRRWEQQRAEPEAANLRKVAQALAVETEYFFETGEEAANGTLQG